MHAILSALLFSLLFFSDVVRSQDGQPDSNVVEPPRSFSTPDQLQSSANLPTADSFDMSGPGNAETVTQTVAQTVGRQSGGVHDSGSQHGAYQHAVSKKPSYGASGDRCNPVTGIRARSGSIYSMVLSNMGVQAGNCGQGASQEGPVNPVTGIRARPGSIYATLLNGAGVGSSSQEGPVNPVTGIRARPGSIYATLLNGAGVGSSSQEGPVNPVTGIRARPGSIYATVLNGAGLGGNTQAGSGLIGNNAIVNFINSNGGLPAVGDSNSDLTTSTASNGVPGWGVALIVLGSIVLVGLIAVLLQLALLLRSGF